FTGEQPTRQGVFTGTIDAADGLVIDADVYTFFTPSSYTGDDLAELHFFAAGDVVQLVLTKILEHTRLAGAGEFTLRAYLNGKMDLSQAEAVAGIIESSNMFQLDAAEKLLAGRLCKTIGAAREEILDTLSLIEAGMDFSDEEDVRFISHEKAAEDIGSIRERLENILSGAIHYEAMIDLPSAAFAGVPNAGKSSLINALLGHERSIISDRTGTTRDVLSGVLELNDCRCTVFDCAGLTANADAADILDQLVQQAATEAINIAELVLFCVDMSKDDYTDDLEILGDLKVRQVILIGTKSDLVGESELAEKQSQLGEMFNAEIIMTSAARQIGIDELKAAIGSRLIKQLSALTEADGRIAVNQRHRDIVTNSVKSLNDAADQAVTGNEELAAMFLRNAYEELAGLEKEDVDEAILDRVFSRFCIGK
ncbi:MAG: 50S ribosome-binding GTPase, partial [Anaerohalosphaera sp.]|nr:50S ribosome-binding GTPase [Anaerohalosphaera sp.]